MTKSLSQKRSIPLIVEIAIVIVCKLILIFTLWFYFFSPEHRPDIDSDKVSDKFFVQKHISQ